MQSHPSCAIISPPLHTLSSSRACFMTHLCTLAFILDVCVVILFHYTSENVRYTRSSVHRDIPHAKIRPTLSRGITYRTLISTFFRAFISFISLLHFPFPRDKKRLTIFFIPSILCTNSMRIVLVLRAIHDVLRGCFRDADLIAQDEIPNPNDQRLTENIAGLLRRLCKTYVSFLYITASRGRIPGICSLYHSCFLRCQAGCYEPCKCPSRVPIYSLISPERDRAGGTSIPRQRTGSWGLILKCAHPANTFKLTRDEASSLVIQEVKGPQVC